MGFDNYLHKEFPKSKKISPIAKRLISNLYKKKQKTSCKTILLYDYLLRIANAILTLSFGKVVSDIFCLRQ